MTRAVLLPAGSDPFLNAYWLRHYRTWADTIDELHVAVCGELPPDVVDYTQRCVQSVGGTMYHIPYRMRHGQVLTLLLDKTQADHILLMEDDAFVRNPVAIADTWRDIEGGKADIVATPRDSYASDELISIARRKFGHQPRGLAFWPCFLFTSREHLEATDRVFDTTLWEAGDDFLGTALTAHAEADTFIWASYQMRTFRPTVVLDQNYRIGEDIPSGAPWFHVGSLSSGHGWGWQGDLTPERYAQEVETWKGLPAGEAAKRMAWWQRAWDHWDGEIPEYHEAYGRGVRQFMADFAIDQGEVDTLRASFDPLITWAES